MKNLFLTWAKCLALAIGLPVLCCILPFAASVDSLLDGQPCLVKLAQYWKQLSQLEVHIRPKQ